METNSLIIIGSIVSITSLIIAILKLANEKSIANTKGKGTTLWKLQR